MKQDGAEPCRIAVATTARRRTKTWLVVITASATLLLVACSFSAWAALLSLCEDFDRIPLTAASGNPPSVVFEDPGTIIVLHGASHASLDKGDPLRVEQSVAVPAYANHATVFLNGWRLSYRGGDQHVAGLGTAIARIRFAPGKLTWNAVGIMRDDDGAEAFNWEYHYTVIAWNDANLHAMIDDNDTEQLCKSGKPDGSDNFYDITNEGMTTALASYASFLQNPGFATGHTVAVLPRGYGFSWVSDHHLLQLAYNLESVAPFVRNEWYAKGALMKVNPLQNSDQAIATGEFVSWKSTVILKDDSDRRDVRFAEVVSGMGGPDVELIQPEFVLQPFDDTSGALGGSGVKSADVEVPNLPYAYVIPMLTGWNIGYSGSDQHVKDIGVWIDAMSFDRATGTLRYKVSSVVRDDDDWPDNFFQHKVSLLCLRPTTRAKAGGLTVQQSQLGIRPAGKAASR